MDGSSRLATRVKLKDAHLITRMTDIADGLTDVIKLGRGDPDLDTPAHIIKTRWPMGPRITRIRWASQPCGKQLPITYAPMAGQIMHPRTSW